MATKQKQDNKEIADQFVAAIRPHLTQDRERLEQFLVDNLSRLDAAVKRTQQMEARLQRILDASETCPLCGAKRG